MGSNSSKDLNQKWTEPGLCGSLGKTETAGIGTNPETVRMKSGQHCFRGSFMCGAKGLPLQLPERLGASLWVSASYPS